jgi:exodeoxyribonuclease VII large subunit
VSVRQEVLFEEPTLTVAELSAGIARLLARGYPDEVWVRGEIANLSRTTWGNVYFDLVEGDCLLRVTLWNDDRLVVNRILRQSGAVRMTDGTDVRIRCRVQWFPKRGTVSLRMLSIDPAYTLGQLAEARERLLAQLREEGLVGRNGALAFPPVPLRVGLVTSAGSAAAADFLRTLEASGWAFRVSFVDVRVQGADAERSLVAALRTLGARSGTAAVDVVCVVRGGGARTDLAAFDGAELARTIAAMPVPVLTGVGHETDTTVADHVAHRAHKTPTACAASVVEHVDRFVDRCRACSASVGKAALAALVAAAGRVDRASGRVVGASRHHLRSHSDRMDAAAARLTSRPDRVLAAAERELANRHARVRSLDPARVLARGWSITRDLQGRVVRAATLAPGDTVVTTVADGSFRSTVESGE